MNNFQLIILRSWRKRHQLDTPPINEIWYWAPAKQTLYGSTNSVSHEFADGKGVIKVKDGTTTFDWYFRQASTVKKVAMNDQFTSVRQLAFQNCTSLETILFSKNITSYSDSTFYGCSKLKLTTMPPGITTFIPNHTFRSCTMATFNKLPDTLTTIGQFAFYDCTSMDITDIPASVATIQAQAFNGCWPSSRAEHTITFHGTPNTIASNAFGNNPNLYLRVPWSKSSGFNANAPWRTDCKPHHL